jgi:biopolymer transport protein ExbB
VKRIQIILVATITWLSLCCSAHAWWHEDWQYRKKIVLNATPAGADIKENLQEIPLLVRLHPGNFIFGNAKNDGSDIRFVSSDDKTPLKHHIERFDSLEEMALLWVRVPRVSAGANADFVWMYYGNEKAMGGQDAAGTYDVNQVVAYHFGEAEGLPQDGTAFGNHTSAFTGGQALPSVIGNGISLNGGGDRIAIAKSPSLDFANGFTFSAWIRITGPMQDSYLFSAQDQQGQIIVALDGTHVYAKVMKGEEPPVATEKSADVPLNSWHHVAVTGSPNGRLIVYLDGGEMTWSDLKGSYPPVSGPVALGASVEESNFFGGELDELAVSNIARSPGWIRTLYASQGPEGLLLNFEQEEINEGGGGALSDFAASLRTVAKNITFDGWLIIGILIFMAGAACAVFVSKAMSLRYTVKEDTEFLESLEKASSPIALEAKSAEYPYSSLYRIYQAGRNELARKVGNLSAADWREHLTPKVLKAITTALEKAYIRETQRLNAWMVLLTLSIAGGPFLGLLGTVWGVMSTFAAMAEAGEANITAIAPGMASALATTVFGLIVAIPALFGYNYLATRVKNMTADLAVFIEDFTVKLEEVGEGKD